MRDKKGRFSKGHKPDNGFKNGNSPWNKGKYVRLNPKGEFKKGQIPWNKGKPYYQMIGDRNPMRRSLSARIKVGLAHKGEKSHWWKGGKTNLVKQIKNSFEWKLWRSRIFERDKYTCQKCNKRGGVLHPHHLKALNKIFLTTE